MKRGPAVIAVVTATLGSMFVLSRAGEGRAAVPPGNTISASLTDGDTAVAVRGHQQSLSADGRYLAFVATEPTPGTRIAPGPGAGTHVIAPNPPTPNTAVYVRDTKTGETAQISVGFQGTAPAKVITAPDFDSNVPSISADGRYVSFMTLASNVVPGPSGLSWSVIMCDRDVPGTRNPDGSWHFAPMPAAGAYPAFLSCVSVARLNDMNEGRPLRVIGTDGWPRMSDDGTRLVWSVQLGTAGSPPIEYRTTSAVVRHGPLAVQAVARVPQVNFAGLTNTDLISPAISRNGKYLVVSAHGTAGEYAILRYTVTGPDPASWPVVRVDRDSAGTGFTGSTTRIVAHPQVSGDGATVVYDTSTPADGPDSFPQVYAVDASRSVTSAPTDATKLSAVVVSVDRNGGQGDGKYPALSEDARYITFVTDAMQMTSVDSETAVGSDCIIGDSTPPPVPRIACQVVARDLVHDLPLLRAGSAAGPAQLASPSNVHTCAATSPWCEGSGDSDGPLTVSGSGSRVSFVSDAADLADAPGRPPGAQLGYVHAWAPALSVLADPFGPVVLGHSSQQVVTLTVAGFGPVDVGSLLVSGPQASEFRLARLTCPGMGSSVNAGAPCTAQITFTPGAIGNRAATLWVFAPNSDPAVDPPLATIPITGTGATAPPANPQFEAVAALDFGTTLPMLEPGREISFTIANPGGTPLSITALAIRATEDPAAVLDYSIDVGSCGVPVTAGASCTARVTFIGHDVGVRNAVLVVTDNAPGGQHTIDLLAVVPPPTLSLNPGVVAASHVVQVTGAGFPPSQPVEVAILESPYRHSVQTGEDGTFSDSVVVELHGESGPRTVAATSSGSGASGSGASGSGASVSAQAPLLVVLGSVALSQPLTRH